MRSCLINFNVSLDIHIPELSTEKGPGGTDVTEYIKTSSSGSLVDNTNNDLCVTSSSSTMTEVGKFSISGASFTSVMLMMSMEGPLVSVPSVIVIFSSYSDCVS